MNIKHASLDYFSTKSLTRIIKAGGYSYQGIRAAWINEAAFRQEAIAWRKLYYNTLNLPLKLLVKSKRVPTDPITELGLDTSRSFL